MEFWVQGSELRDQCSGFKPYRAIGFMFLEKFSLGY